MYMCIHTPSSGTGLFRVSVALVAVWNSKPFSQTHTVLSILYHVWSVVCVCVCHEGVSECVCVTLSNIQCVSGEMVVVGGSTLTGVSVNTRAEN